jgi:hypothetical protein
MASQDSNNIITFAHDPITDQATDHNNERAYREIRDLTVWCQDNTLSFNVSKTKGLIVDYRKRRAEHALIIIDRAVFERVESFNSSMSSSLRITVYTH